MRRRLLAASLLLLATGCAIPIGMLDIAQPYYSRGDFDRTYGDRAHALTTVGCVDVAASLRDADRAVVLDLRIGNHCGDAAMVDLTRLRLYAAAASGEKRACSLDDPNEEIRALPLPGRAEGFEPIAIRDAGSAEELCVDVSSVVSPRRGDPGVVPPLCFTKRSDRWLRDRSKS